MPTPTSRLLDVLELLQSRPFATGRELADRLGVDPRTVRRYMNALEDLGIPAIRSGGDTGSSSPDYSWTPGRNTRISLS